MRKLVPGFPTRSDTNRPVQPQKQARTLFQIKEEELYYLCSENKGADQLCSYCENPIFSWRSSYHAFIIECKWQESILQVPGVLELNRPTMVIT